MNPIYELATILSDTYRRTPWGEDAFEEQAKALILAGYTKDAR